jgi:hypothetical protein
VGTSRRGFLAASPPGLEAQRLESTAVLRSGRHSAQGVLQLAREVQGRAAASWALTALPASRVESFLKSPFIPAFQFDPVSFGRTAGGV